MITMVDMDARWTFDKEACFTKAREVMRFAHNMPMQGKVMRTMVRGETIYNDGKIVGTPGHGRWLKPA